MAAESAVIEASSVQVKTLADDTLRLTVDVEPRFAKQAFALFGNRGTPMALAALKVGKAAQESEPDNELKGPLGPLCLYAVQRCDEQDFRDWLADQTMAARGTITKSRAKEILLNTCNIKSRRELDTNEVAAAIFKRKVMRPYAAWLEKQGSHRESQK